MTMRLEVHPERCTGCNSCMLACSFQHAKRFSREAARIRPERDLDHAESHPRVCVQCDAAPCIDACPVSALSRHPRTGAILLDDDLCTGCQNCVSACPYVGIYWDASRSIPLICDLCGGAPQCVSFCQFPQALTLVATGEEAIE
jgi:carbon-monoxide dehydrogenase iron sulfur subunit